MYGRIIASAPEQLDAIRESGRWPVVIIEAGWSKNGYEYHAHVLREACERGVFEGVPAAAYGLVGAGGESHDADDATTH